MTLDQGHDITMVYGKLREVSSQSKELVNETVRKGTSTVTLTFGQSRDISMGDGQQI